MSGFPGSPLLLKGALISLQPPNPNPSVIIFQYNPDSVTRTLKAQVASGSDSDRSEALRLKGAPEENIKLDVVIDATDQLEKASEPASTMGIYPQLAALEMLLYPSSISVIKNMALLAAGTIEVVPESAQFTLLVWGPFRVLPVRLTGFTITEEAHDTKLNPIRAKIPLDMRVLSYSDLDPSHMGYNLFLAHQVSKEIMAKLGMVASLGAGMPDL
ncbi:MAG: hypothetical protein OEY64_10595 [Nitrospinota bacterium]|nr:hypothetical protein [Nitrospinota bacterium]